MPALTKIQKEAILKGINRLPVKNIHKFIERGEFSLLDCIEEHELKLNKLDIKGSDLTLLEWLIMFIDSDQLSIEVCRENGVSSDIIKQLEDHYQTIIQKKAQFEEDKKFYDKINNDELIIQEIQESINNGKVRKEGLLKHTIIDNSLYDSIVAYDKIHEKIENNENPLKKGSTDIFFFGKKASGKSCVLASIFSYGDNQGLFIHDMHSHNGILYKNLLVRELNAGLLPNRTPADVDSVTYITTSLKWEDPKTKKKESNPLNIIEMSGEFFTDATQEGIGENSIDAHGYLSSKNKKLLFFIVDYERYKEGETTRESTQSEDFDIVLSQLDLYERALKDTYCIYIIVTKSDLFPEDVTNKNTYAKEFFMDNFRSVYTNLKEKQKTHKFKTRVMHFSLGKFIFNNSYLHEFNEECPRDLIESISRQAARKKGRGFLGGLFDFEEEL